VNSSVNGLMMTSSTVIARLRPGIPIEAARKTLARGPDGSDTVTVQALGDYMTGRVHSLALGALLSGFFVLFVCAANSANLLLVSATYRDREFAIRRALGSSRSGLARLLFLETAIAGVAATIIGALLTSAILSICRALVPDEYILLGQPHFTARVLVVLFCA